MWPPFDFADITVKTIMKVWSVCVNACQSHKSTLCTTLSSNTLITQVSTPLYQNWMRKYNLWSDNAIKQITIFSLAMLSHKFQLHYIRTGWENTIFGLTMLANKLQSSVWPCYHTNFNSVKSEFNEKIQSSVWPVQCHTCWYLEIQSESLKLLSWAKLQSLIDAALTAAKKTPALTWLKVFVWLRFLWTGLAGQSSPTLTITYTYKTFSLFSFWYDWSQKQRGKKDTKGGLR